MKLTLCWLDGSDFSAQNIFLTRGDSLPICNLANLLHKNIYMWLVEYLAKLLHKYIYMWLVEYPCWLSLSVLSALDIQITPCWLDGSAFTAQKMFSYPRGYSTYMQSYWVNPQKHLYVIGRISLLSKLVRLSLPQVEEHVPWYFLTDFWQFYFPCPKQ